MADPITQVLFLLGPIAVLLSVLVLIFWAHNKNNERRHRIWRQEAEAAGLSFREGGGEIEGFGLYAASVESEIHAPLPGGHMRICRIHNPTGHRKHFTHGRVDFEAPAALGLSLASRGLLSFGGHLKTGDERFDERFMTQSGGDRVDLSALSPPVRTALLELLLLVDSVELDDKGLRWQTTSSLIKDGQVARVAQATVAANAVLQAVLRGRPLDELDPPDQRRHTLPAGLTSPTEGARRRSAPEREGAAEVEAAEVEAAEVTSSRRRG